MEEGAEDYKTRLCMGHFGRNCGRHRLECYFAHGNRDLSLGRAPYRLWRYKRELCKFTKLGRKCPYGARCWFAHSDEEKEHEGECQLFKAIGTCYHSSSDRQCPFIHHQN